jgi:predicted oxidoreductase
MSFGVVQLHVAVLVKVIVVSPPAELIDGEQVGLGTTIDRVFEAEEAAKVKADVLAWIVTVPAEAVPVNATVI